MNRYLQTVKAELLSDGGEIFDRFREMFGEERTELENLCAHAGQALEYAFDFMEGTFGSSQEMVVFITELNSSARQCGSYRRMSANGIMNTIKIYCLMKNGQIF